VCSIAVELQSHRWRDFFRPAGSNFFDVASANQIALVARFVGGDGVRAAMKQDRFEVPLTVKSGETGDNLMLRTAREASDYLLNKWPGKKSPKHRAALQACHDAIAGDKPVMTARRAFIAAAREADVLVSEKAA
jgi:hypothetical protein